MKKFKNMLKTQAVNSQYSTQNKKRPCKTDVKIQAMLDRELKYTLSHIYLPLPPRYR